MADAEQQPLYFSSDRLRRVGRWVVIGLALLGCAYGALSVGLQMVFDAEYIEGRVNEMLADSTGGLYRADIEAVHWSVWHRSFRAERVTLQPDSATVRRLQQAGQSPARTYRVRVPEIRLRSIQLWPLVWRRALKLDTLALQRPHVRLHARPNANAAPSDSTESSDPSDRSAYSVHKALAQRLPKMKAHQVVIEKGSVALNRRPDSPADTLWGISVRLDGVTVDSTSARDTSRVLFSNHITAAFAGYRRVFDDSLYAFTTGPARISTRDASVVVDSLRLSPTVSDSLFMQQQGVRTNRYETAAHRVALRGFDVWRFLEERSLISEGVFIDSLVVDVYRNNHLPQNPNDPLPKMPHEAIRQLRRTVRLDTIRVRGGTIRYVRLDEAGTRPGAISFEEVSAWIYNATNDPRRMTQDTPAVVEATARVAGRGRLQTTIRLPLLSAHLALSYRGYLGPMDARALNDPFVNLAGIRVESGRVDSLWFAAEIQRGVASGTMQGIYRNLEVEMLDKATKERGLRKRVGTFVLNTLALKSRNTSENGSLRTGAIDHAYEEGDSFFKFLWHSVRSGIYALVGL